MIIQLQFPLSQSIHYQDVRTFTVSVELFLKGIHTTQPDYNRLEFDSDRDFTRALALLWQYEREFQVRVLA